jgi:hypothetical protein
MQQRLQYRHENALTNLSLIGMNTIVSTIRTESAFPVANFRFTDSPPRDIYSVHQEGWVRQYRVPK